MKNVLVWLTIFAEEGEGGGDAVVADTDAAVAPAVEDKTFTQEQVNKILAEDRRKHQGNTAKALEELEAVKAKAQLSENERTELDSRIELLNNTLLTKEEIALKEKNTLEKKYKTDFDALTEKHSTLESKYNEETITRAITDASVSTDIDAFNPAQIVAILKPNTQLVEVLDENGKPTGAFKPMVKFDDINEDGKPVTLDLTILEACKRMTEMDNFLNLFKGKGTGGTGGIQRGTGKEPDIVAIARDDPKKYAQMRREGKLKL